MPLQIFFRRDRQFNDQLYGWNILFRPYSCVHIATPLGRKPNFLTKGQLYSQNTLFWPYSSARIVASDHKIAREGTPNSKTSILFLSSTSKLSQNLKRSSSLLNFIRFPRTQVIYGMFLLRSSNYFLQIHLRSIVIINLGWDLLWTNCHDSLA